MANRPFDQTVRDFLEVGAIVYLSDDAVFIRALRNIVTRIIGVRGEVLYPFANTGTAMAKCLELRNAHVPCVVFIERRLNGRPTTDFIVQLKQEFPEVRMIVLTSEATREAVTYFFELGVSRVLVKPASADKVIEDLAATLDPPSSLKNQLSKCARLLAERDFDEALEVTDRILLLRPDCASGLVMRGDALMGIGETDKAVQSYITAHENRPIFMAPLIKLAAAFNDMEDDRALAYMKELDAISPLNPERKLEIAKQHLRKGDAEQAETYLDKSVEVCECEQPGIAGDLTERIVDAVAADAPELAVKYLSRVIDSKQLLGRDDLIHFNRLGIILRGQGKWQEAVKIYEKGLNIVRNDPALHYNMGLAYWQGEERTTAMRCFETALALDPEFHKQSLGAAMNIGALYLELRRYEEAEPFFEYALELDPDNATARKRLGRAQNRIPSTSPPRSDPEAGPSYNVDAPAKADGKGRKNAKGARRKSGRDIKLDF
jgi:tetratricopeptide (TPR) repeat protein